MTKAIRIENADTSDHKIVIQVWETGQDVGDGIVEPDTLVKETRLNYPTALTEECIHRNRYIVVKEID